MLLDERRADFRPTQNALLNPTADEGIMALYRLGGLPHNEKGRPQPGPPYCISVEESYQAASSRSASTGPES